MVRLIVPLALACYFAALAADKPPKLRLTEVQNLTPERYRADLTLDPDKAEFSGNIRIQVKVYQPVQTIWLNANRIAVQKASVIAAGLPLAEFLGGLALMAAEFGDQRDHAGGATGHQDVGFLPPVVAHQQPAGAAGQIGHVGASLVEDQIQAGAQPVSALLEGCDAGITARDFERYGGAGFL
jgi:hypothetical protein